MTVVGRGLVFQPVLVTQTRRYNSNNIIALQNIDITDFPSKKKFFFKEHTNPLTPLKKAPKNKQNKNTTTVTKEAMILANVLTCH